MSVSARIPRSALVVLLLALAAAVVLHLHAGFRFPVAWVDEAHFLAPARNLWSSATLTAPELNAPRGIFWLPDGFYALLAPVSASLRAARALSLLALAVFAACLVTAMGRRRDAAVPAAAVVSAWLVAPGVVMMGNIARQEAPVLAVAGVALLLGTHRRWLAAGAVAALAPLVHPIGLVVLAGVGVAALWLRDGDVRRGDVVLAGLVAAAWFAELAWFAVNADLARAHLAFQLARKADRPLMLAPTRLALLTGAAAGTLAAALPRRRARDAPASLLCFVLAGGFVLVAAVGNEMWYEALGGVTAAALLAIGVVALPWRPRLLAPAVVLAAAAVTVSGVSATLSQPLYAMTTSSGEQGEWLAFTHDAVTALERLDAGLDAPATLAVHRLSGLGPWLYDRRWRHLRVVQPTPVTPLPAPDYLLVTLDRRPAARSATEAEVPTSAPVLTLRSSQRTYELRVYARDRS